MDPKDSLKLALTEIQRDQLFSMMRETIRRFALDVLYSVNGNLDLPPDGDKWISHEAHKTLERMLSICNGDGWDAIGGPIMQRRAAEELRMASLVALAEKVAVTPSPFFLAELAKRLNAPAGES